MKKFLQALSVVLILAGVALADVRDSLVGSWQSDYAPNPGMCTIAKVSMPTRPGSWVSLTNQYNMTAYGWVDARASVVTVDQGAWPDATADHPLVGTLEDNNGQIYIQWGALRNGQSGGKWFKR